MVGTAAVNSNHLPDALDALLYKGKWWKHKGIVALNGYLFLCLITSSMNGYDGSMMNGLQAVDEWKNRFGDPEGSTKGLLNAVQNIGAIIGLPFCPYMNDLFGRKSGLAVGSVIMLAGIALQCASKDIAMFIGARGLIGFGLTFAQNSAPLLIVELSYPSQRAVLTSIYNSLWYSGSIIAAWTTFGTFRITNDWSWRIPSLLQGIPSILQLVFIFWIPESPRWLISRGRDEEALKILAKYHTEDRTNIQDPLIEYEYAEIKTGLEMEKETSSSWLQLFKTRGNRRRMRIILAIAFFSQWSGNGLASYYLTDILDGVGITSQTIQTLFNGILQIFNLAVALSASFLVERFGRRTLFIASTTGMLISFTCWTIASAQYSLHGNKNAGNAVLGFIYLFYLSYDIAFSPLIVSYTVEILPFKIRAKGLMLFNFFVSASLVFNQYVNPIALDAIGWKYYIVFCVWLAFELVFVYFYVVETKNLTLEETMVIFDGENAVEEVKNQGATHTVQPIGVDEKNDFKTPSIEHHEHASDRVVSSI